MQRLRNIRKDLRGAMLRNINDETEKILRHALKTRKTSDEERRIHVGE